MLRRLEIQRGQGEQRALSRSVTPREVTALTGMGETGVRYSDGSLEASSCLRCPDAPCLRFRTTELQPPAMQMFPGDGDLSVCPTGALSWPLDTGTGPRIEENACIGCGLCVQRCPVGAIQLGADAVARVLDVDTDSLKASSGADAVGARAHFERAKRTPRIAVASDNALERLSARVADVGSRVGSRFPNLFARNLLVVAGWTTSMRRAGDTNVRMDLLAQRGAELCVTEVEFSDAVIDAPRSVLDGVAVLRNRYGVAAASSVGLVVAGSLPNHRSEYWHVLADIEKALGLRVHTVSAGSLVLLVWEGAPLKCLPFASLGNPSIRKDIEKCIGAPLSINPGAAAALEAPK